MSKAGRWEVVGRYRNRYRSAGRKYRRKLIDQLCAVCGYVRKYAIKVLSGNRPGPQGKGRGGPHPICGREEKTVVRTIWEWTDYPCGKRLAAALPLWLPSYEQNRGVLPAKQRQRILKVSPATLDRLLATERSAIHLHRGTTKPGNLLRTQIPVRCDSWVIDRPGFLEADTVDHGGSSTSGSYMHSVTYTDIHTGWIEQAALWNKGAAGVVRVTKEIEAQLPFPLLGFDCDNGGEFINHHLWQYLQTRPMPIEFTRSRSYHSNDNAHVEQKNWSKVRLLLGYERYDQPEVVNLVHALYRNEWRLLQNFFQPVMKLVEKRREGGKIKKRYDTPKTPAQRVLAWKGLLPKDRDWLLRMQAELNPRELMQAVQRQTQSIRKLLAQTRRHRAA